AYAAASAMCPCLGRVGGCYRGGSDRLTQLSSSMHCVNRRTVPRCGVRLLAGDQGVKYLSLFVICLAQGAIAPTVLYALPNKKASADGFRQVSRAELDVSDGKVGEKSDGSLTTDSPEVRATQRARSAKAARLVFTFHGPTKEESKLASGQVARQIGLKLRAKNTCNLLYVMWKLDGKERVAVSVKRNPGQSTHKECGAKG